MVHGYVLHLPACAAAARFAKRTCCWDMGCSGAPSSIFGRSAGNLGNIGFRVYGDIYIYIHLPPAHAREYSLSRGPSNSRAKGFAGLTPDAAYKCCKGLGLKI